MSQVTFLKKTAAGSISTVVEASDSLQIASLGLGVSAPVAGLSIGSSTEFQVNATGDLVKINNVSYSWPASQGGASTFLQNDSFGVLTWVSLPSGIISGTGTTDTIPKFTGTSTIGDSVILESSGNIGIGASPATFKLQVAGHAGPNADNTYDLGSPVLRWRDLYLGPASLHIYNQADATDFDQIFLGYETNVATLRSTKGGTGTARDLQILTGTGSTPALYVTSANTVDIGGTAGANKLTVTTDGSVGTPAISLGATPDSDTGVYHPNANELAVTTGGTRRALFSSAGLNASLLSVASAVADSTAIIAAQSDQDALTRFTIENSSAGTSARVGATFSALSNSTSLYVYPNANVSIPEWTSRAVWRSDAASGSIINVRFGDFKVTMGAESNTYHLKLDSSGNALLSSTLGIGTTATSSPSLLHVKTTGAGGALVRAETTASAQLIEYALQTDTGQSLRSSLYLTGSTFAAGDVGDPNTLVLLNGNTSSGALKLGTNNTNRLQIGFNGNVGVGNSTIPTLFSVGATAQFQVSSTGLLGINRSPTLHPIVAEINQNSATTIVAANTTDGTAASTGFICDGPSGTGYLQLFPPNQSSITTYYADKLVLYTTTSASGIVINAAGGPVDLVAGSSTPSAPMLRVATSGNVGVNVTSPLYKFHVVAGTTGAATGILLQGDDHGPAVGSLSTAANHYALEVTSSMTSTGSGAVDRFVVMSDGKVNVGNPAASGTPPSGLFSVGATSQFQVDSNGYIGINVTPSANYPVQAEVNQNSTTSMLSSNQTNGTGSSSGFIASGATGTSYWVLFPSNQSSITTYYADKAVWFTDTSTSGIVINAAGGPVDITAGSSTPSAPMLRVKTNGAVEVTTGLSVGTTTPDSSSILAVQKDHDAVTRITVDNGTNGASAVTSVTVGSNAASINLACFPPAHSAITTYYADKGVIFTDTGTSGIVINAAGGPVDLVAGSSTPSAPFMRVATSGNIDIGGTAAANKLTVSLDGDATTPAISLGTSADSNTGIFHPTADTLAITNGGTETIRFNSSQQVGIGVSPTEKLSLKAHAAFAGSESNTTTSAVQTTTNSATTLWTKTLADTTLYWAEVIIIGRDAAGTDRAKYHKEVLVYREGGAATIQGGVDDVVADRETNGAWDGTFTVNSNDLRVTITGANATTVNWVCTVRIQAVSGNA